MPSRVCPGSWFDEFRAVIVGWIAVNGVNVVEIALLRRILDDDRGTLDAVVRQTAVVRATAPGEPGSRKGGFDFRHLRRRRLVVEDTHPLVREVKQHSLLAGVQLGFEDA